MANALSLTRSYDRIFSLVSDKAQPVIWDNVSARTALLFRMKEVGAILMVGGAPHLRFTIMNQLPTTSAYTDLDIISPARADPYTSIVYVWKQLRTPIQVSGLDMVKTDGADGITNLLTGMIDAAQISLRDALGGSTVGIFANAGETTLTAISGLQNMLTSSTTTGTVGQHSRVTDSNWRHQSANVSSDFNSNGLNRFRTLKRQCGRFDEQVDTIVVTGSTLDNYERALTSTFRVNVDNMADAKMLEAGFDSIYYKGALIFSDDGCPANYGYFLNLAKYTRLLVREGRAAEVGDFVKSKDYDDLCAHVFWAGNLITTNLARQGVLLNADTWS